MLAVQGPEGRVGGRARGNDEAVVGYLGGCATFCDDDGFVALVQARCGALHEAVAIGGVVFETVGDRKEDFVDG